MSLITPRFLTFYDKILVQFRFKLKKKSEATKSGRCVRFLHLTAVRRSSPRAKRVETWDEDGCAFNYGIVWASHSFIQTLFLVIMVIIVLQSNALKRRQPTKFLTSFDKFFVETGQSDFRASVNA